MIAPCNEEHRGRAQDRCTLERLCTTIDQATASFQEYNAWRKSVGLPASERADMLWCFVVALAPDTPVRALAVRCLESLPRKGLPN